MPTVYITEPQAIPVERVRQILPESYDIVEGDTDFMGAPASRGGIVDEAAVSAAAAAGTLTYIADTVVNEPHSADCLIGNDNIIVTPHIGSLTEESEAAMLSVALQNYLQAQAND